MSKITIETRERLHHDSEGAFIEIGPDPDGLNLVTIVSDNTFFGKCNMTFDPDVACELANLLQRAADRAKKQEMLDNPHMMGAAKR